MSVTTRSLKAKKGTENMYRQGDVFIVAMTAAIPKDARPVTNAIKGRIVLAYGEATGHHHSIAVLDREAELLESATTTDRFLRIMAASGVELTHQEHATITLPPGDYVVRQQREWTDAEEPIRVAD